MAYENAYISIKDIAIHHTNEGKDTTDEQQFVVLAPFEANRISMDDLMIGM